MLLRQLISKHCMSFDVDLKTKEEVFHYLGQQLLDSGYIETEEDYFKAVCYRETLSATGLGDGIAIPHGKSSCVKKAGIAFVRLKQPIAWESLDDGDVTYVFLLAIPEGREDEIHIRMISELARCLIKTEVIEKVKNAHDANELLDVL